MIVYVGYEGDSEVILSEKAYENMIKDEVDKVYNNYTTKDISDYMNEAYDATDILQMVGAGDSYEDIMATVKNSMRESIEDMVRDDKAWIWYEKEVLDE